MVNLVEPFVEEGKVQHPMGPVEHKLFEQNAETQLRQVLESC